MNKMNTTVTIPLLALIGQFVALVLVLIAVSNKWMNRISKIEGRIDNLDTNALYVKEEFSKNSSTNEKVLDKLENIRGDVGDIKAQLKYKNGTKL